MGVCSSCLGGVRVRDRDLTEEDESSRLLFDDPNGNHYGSFADPHAGVPQADPQEVQRETEALQKVVAQTSTHLVDIFAMAPPNGQLAAANTSQGQDAKILHYQDVLAKLSTDDQSIGAKPLSAENTPNVSDGWLSDEEDFEEMKNYKPVKSEGIGPLLGGFADANPATE